MNILVTGSLGFIGSKVMQALKDAGHEVLGVDKKVGTSTTDFEKMMLLTQQRFPKLDMIVHTAGSCSTSRSLKEPQIDFQDNVIGTYNMADLARLTGAKVIYLSTCKVQPGDDGARTPYGLSKFIGELYLEEYSKDFGVEYIINRMGTIYGPGQHGSSESGWISWFIKATVEQLPITVFGNGEQQRDVLHVDDLVRLIVIEVRRFEEMKNKTYDVGGGEDNVLSVNQTLSEVLNYANYSYDKARTGDAMLYVADIKPLQGIWEPHIMAVDGVKSTLNFYKKQRESMQ